MTSLYAFTHGRGAFKVTANMSGCNFSLAQTGRSVAAAGSDLTVNVSVAPNGCNWTAASNVPWITVQPGSGGTTSLSTFRSWTGFEMHGLAADPGFVDVTANDYRLAADSPAMHGAAAAPTNDSSSAT